MTNANIRGTALAAVMKQKTRSRRSECKGKKDMVAHAKSENPTPTYRGESVKTSIRFI